MRRIKIHLIFLLGTTLNMGIYGVWWGIVIINCSAEFISHIYTSNKLRKLKLQMINKETTRESLNCDPLCTDELFSIKHKPSWNYFP